MRDDMLRGVPSPAPRSRHLIGLFLWACATLLLELALTRVLSVTLWYHFGFLVISTALLGFGIAGTTLSVWPWLRDRAPLDDALGGLAAAFGVLAVVSFRVLQWMPFDPFSALADPRQLILGPLVYLVLSLPFLAAGLGLALLFTRMGGHAARLYAFDLTGAGLGCLLLLLVLPVAGGPGTVLVVAGMGFAAATVFLSTTRRRAMAACAVATVVAIAAVPAAPTLLPLTITPLKLRPRIAPLEAHWNTSSLVEIFALRPPWLRGQTTRRFVIDGGTAATGMVDLTGGARTYLAAHGDDTDYMSGVAYVGKARPRVLVIGAGGGDEVLAGLHYGASSITAVEVNPTIVDVVSRRMRDFWGDLYGQPEVRLVADEGRSYLRRSTETFDAIISIHTISNAAVTSGALSLTENYVLTREAFEDYLDHLSPDGVILFSRPEPQMPRLVATAREALQERGIDDASGHLYLFRSVPDEAERTNLGGGGQSFEAEVLVKKSPFTAEEVVGIERIARLGLPPRDDADTPRETVYSPLAPDRSGIYYQIATTPDLPAFYRAHPRELAPATDDRPFFNHLTRWSSLDWSVIASMAGMSRAGSFLLGDQPVAEVSLLLLLVQTGLVAAAFILWPLTRAGAGLGSHWPSLVYFAALGFGFITIEMALISRLTLYLGQPAYTIALVLASLLVCTGLGAAWAERLRAPRTLQRVLAGLLIVDLLATFAMPAVLSATLGLPFVARLAVAFVLLAPLGVLAGMPFPLGLRSLAGRAPALVPWAWGVNGFFTVIGTVSSLILAMTFGFTTALLVGTGCYAVAALVSPRGADGRV